jgi:hypothetical protein
MQNFFFQGENMHPVWILWSNLLLRVLFKASKFERNPVRQVQKTKEPKTWRTIDLCYKMTQNHPKGERIFNTAMNAFDVGCGRMWPSVSTPTKREIKEIQQQLR